MEEGAKEVADERWLLPEERGEGRRRAVSGRLGEEGRRRGWRRARHRGRQRQGGGHDPDAPHPSPYPSPSRHAA